MTRRQVHYSGEVQGVGFRFTTEAIATKFAVTGYVKNLPDGRVELVAEGAQDELDRFQSEIAKAMRGCIENVHVATAPATGEFAGFSIRH